MFNKIILVGNLTRDVEIRYTSSNLAIGHTGIATNRKFKSQTGEAKEEVLFVDLSFFGRTAEIANQYLRKGSKVLVEGRLKLDQWTDQSGQKRSKHSVTVEVLQMLDSRQDREELGSMDNSGSGKQDGSRPSVQADKPNSDTTIQYEPKVIHSDEDIPF